MVMRRREQFLKFSWVWADRSVRLTLVLATLVLTGCQQAGWLMTGKSEAETTTEPVAPEDMPGIVTEPAGSEIWPATMTRVGWYAPPAAATTLIRAPATGFTVTRDAARWPAIGERVAPGRSPVQIGVFLTPQEIAQLIHLKEDTDTQMQQSLVTMQLTEEQLRAVAAARNAVSGVRVDQIREAYEHARAAYDDAKEKLPFLSLQTTDTGVALRPVQLDSPRAGVVTEVTAAPGQFVLAGDPLYTIADWSVLWIRVPVFEGDLGSIDSGREARVTDRVTKIEFAASPLRHPTEPRPGGRAFDLWYAVDNAAGRLQPGRTAIVELPMPGAGHGTIIIQRSAVLYDGFGQTACFVAREDGGFERRRIELGGTRGDHVAVTRGLDAGELVVVVGAEQLAGRAAAVTLAVEDDD